MNIPEKAVELVAGLVQRLTPAENDDTDLHTSEVYDDPDEFENFSDYDSLMVDSKEGAPE